MHSVVELCIYVYLLLVYLQLLRLQTSALLPSPPERSDHGQKATLMMKEEEDSDRGKSLLGQKVQ